MAHTQFLLNAASAFLGTVLALLLWAAVFAWRGRAQPMEDEVVIMDHSEPNPVGFHAAEGSK